MFVLKCGIVILNLRCLLQQSSTNILSHHESYRTFQCQVETIDTITWSTICVRRAL